MRSGGDSRVARNHAVGRCPGEIKVMKKIVSLFVSCAVSFFLTQTAIAGTVSGFVFCDANGDQVIDSNDVPIAGVTVIVTGLVGTFSNSTVTGPDGSFSLQIPPFDPLALRLDPLSQTYVETLDTNTLPAGSTIISPLPIVTQSPTNAYYIDYLPDFINVGFNSGIGATTNGDWLINNPDCQAQSVGSCSLSGSGVIKGGKGKNGKQSFGGKVSSSGGRWTHTTKTMQFKSTSIDTVDCSGNNGITFSGTGILNTGKGKKKTSVTVSFTAFVQDNGKGKKNRDQYYINISDGDTTLLLVSTDPADPTDVAPVTISSGNLTVKSQ
jgi:hypothetical protein